MFAEVTAKNVGVLFETLFSFTPHARRMIKCFSLLQFINQYNHSMYVLNRL